MSIYLMTNYKTFIKDWLGKQPRGGRGLLTKLADHVGSSPAMITHVLSGDKDFSMEVANDVASFMGLSDEETEYFLLLVSYGRAGSHSLQERLKRKISL